MNSYSVPGDPVTRTRLEPGKSTAWPLNVTYRIGRIAHLVSGRWLDLGCANGGYSAELLRRGVGEVVGVDTEPEGSRRQQAETCRMHRSRSAAARTCRSLTGISTACS